MADDTHVLTARTLRGLAHPLRVQLLGMLRADGPATASGLAKRLGESSGTTSWHLRQLAAHGFVEEDTERGNRKERWWRSVHRSTQLQHAEFMSRPDDVDAMTTLMTQLLDSYRRNAADFLAETPSWDRPWAEAADISDWILHLTAADLAQLRDRVHAVVADSEREARPGDEQVVVQIQLFPRRAGHGER